MVAWIATLNSQVKIIWTVSEQTTSDMTNVSNLHLSELSMSALSAQLNKPSQIISKQRKVNIAHPQKSVISLQPRGNSISTSPLSGFSTKSDEDQTNTDTDQPYRYHEKQQDILLAGWRLPANYVLNADELQSWLLTLPNWQRIKGVVNTSDGWLQINFTPDSLTTSTASVQVDSRIEIILQLDENDNAVKESTVKEDVTKEDTAIEYTPELSATAIDWEALDQELMAMVVSFTAQA